MNKLNINKRKAILDYIKKYPNIFSENEIEMILKYTEINPENILVPEFIRGIYDELNFLKDEENIYIGFIKLINELFDIKQKNIVEIGGGVLPRLGERIALFQSKGSITVYDPRLSIYKKDTSTLKLVRERFNKNIDVTPYDLLIGLMPCKAAEDIVEAALKNRKDFVIALCEGGVHGDEEDFYEDDEEWRRALIKYASRGVEQNNMGNLNIKYLKKYHNPYPIIYNER